jgi:hypothetical protein
LASIITILIRVYRTWNLDIQPPACIPVVSSNLRPSPDQARVVPLISCASPPRPVYVCQLTLGVCVEVSLLAEPGFRKAITRVAIDLEQRLLKTCKPGAELENLPGLQHDFYQVCLASALKRSSFWSSLLLPGHHRPTPF